jgi:PAS domain S-box-containing protein
MKIRELVLQRYEKFKSNQLSRVYYLLLIFTGLLVSVIISQYLLYYQKQNIKRIESIKQENVIKARIFEEHAKRTFSNVEQILRDVMNNYYQNPSQFSLNNYSRHLFVGYKDLIIQITIFDENGNLTTASEPGIRIINISDRVYFNYHKNHPDSKMLISRPLLGKFAGKMIIPASLRLNKKDGSFGGLVVASVNPYYFSNFFKQVVEGRIFLVNREGYIIASWTDSETDELGKDYSKTNAFIMSRYSSKGIEISKSIFDQEERIRAFRVISPYDIVVVVTYSKKQAVKQDRENLLLFGAYSIFLIAFILLFTFWASRSLKHEQLLHHVIRESEMKANTILKTATEGILVIRNFKIVYYNPSVLRILKASPDYVFKRSILDFVYDEDKEDLLFKYRKLYKNKNRIIKFEFRALQMDKDMIWVHVDTVPIVWQGQSAVLACMYDITETRKWAELEKQQYIRMESMNNALQREITERKSLEELNTRILNEVKEKNLELEKFVYTVSHDLRSPLITIKGFSHFANRDIHADDKEKALKDLEKIDFSADKMSGLIDDLLELSRAGRVMRPFTENNLNQIVKDVMEILQIVITQNNAKICFDGNLPVVIGDNLKIRQLFQNLIENALKYRHPDRNPEINIGYNVKGKYIFVRDNGIGIEEKDYEKIFEVFSKLNSDNKGSGIGLSIVKRIVDLHKGRITVKSEFGEYTEFLFTLSENKAGS